MNDNGINAHLEWESSREKEEVSLNLDTIVSSRRYTSVSFNKFISSNKILLPESLSASLKVKGLKTRSFMNDFLDKVILYDSQSLTPWETAEVNPPHQTTPLDILFGGDHSSDKENDDEISFAPHLK